MTSDLLLRSKRPPAACARLWLALCLALPGNGLAGGTNVLSGHVPAAVATGQAQPVARLAGTDSLRLTLGLPLRNEADLDRLLEGLYNPGKADFHHYLSPEQFIERFGPTRRDYARVLEFARTNGLEVKTTFDDRVLIEVEAPVATIESAFHVTLRNYWDAGEARLFHAPDREPWVDPDVPILTVTGLNSFFQPHPMVRRQHETAGGTSSGGSAPNGVSFLGNDFRHAYAPDVAQTGSGQMVGLVEFEGYYASDITAYESLAGISPGVPLQNVVLPGFSMNTANDDGIQECSLDIEMVVSMAPGLSKLYVFEGTGTDQMLQAMVSSNQISQFSCSWGLARDATAEGYFKRMAAQGQTFFIASGDGDAYAGSIWWAGDEPFVTSVGGTTLTMTNQGAGYASEKVWNWGNNGKPWCCNGQTLSDPYWGSGGGISTIYSIPYWQQGVNATSVGGSATMRNVPDVAMTADQIWVNWNHTSAGNIGGTSAAAPLWAGYLALVNQAAAAGGKPPVGFLNPALYAIGQSASYASCFHDVTNGDSTWPMSTNLYKAAPGYDLCTGWGTPRGAALLNGLAGLAGPVFVDFHYSGNPQTGEYATPYHTLAQGVTAVASRGTIFIERSGSSAETMTIRKPMKIDSNDGPATIGH